MPAVSTSELWRWQHAAAPGADLHLASIDFEAIPGWGDDRHGEALECFFETASLTSAGIVPEGLISRRAHAADARAFFESNFTAHRVLAEPGLLTSYFEPLLEGSREPSPVFSVPVYRRPPDLHPLPACHPLRARGLTAARDAGGESVPYFTRAEIEAGALASRDLALIYLNDPIAAFVMHVQGSGAIKLDGGSTVRLSFDGKNGHPYTSVGKLMVERGHLTLENASLDAMMSWLRAHPSQSGTLLAENKSYIFFKELESGAKAPRGSMGAPLTQGRSLAADPRYHPLGLPIWVSAPKFEYEGQPFRRLMVAQDTGSAIAGPQRGDLFAGSGADARGIAGRVRHVCEFIVFRPKMAL